jgi:ankyrin repeat protein
MTPLMFACQHNKASLTQLLLIHDCDVNHQDVRGWTAFAYASNAGNEVLMQLLLQAGSNLQAVTNGGETKAVLMEASRCCCFHCVCYGGSFIEANLSEPHSSSLTSEFSLGRYTVYIRMSVLK